MPRHVALVGIAKPEGDIAEVETLLNELVRVGDTDLLVEGVGGNSECAAEGVGKAEATQTRDAGHLVERDPSLRPSDQLIANSE
jgi:hypothetical protein